MSYISNRHRNISIWEDNPEILTDPEKYFGPNYKILLNAWIYRESLQLSERDLYQLRWENLGGHIHQLQLNNIKSVELNESAASSRWEGEIINADKILDSGGQLYSVPLLTPSEVSTDSCTA